MWSNSRTTMSVSPQSAHGWACRYSATSLLSRARLAAFRSTYFCGLRRYSRRSHLRLQTLHVLWRPSFRRVATANSSSFLVLPHCGQRFMALRLLWESEPGRSLPGRAASAGRESPAGAGRDARCAAVPGCRIRRPGGPISGPASGTGSVSGSARHIHLAPVSQRTAHNLGGPGGPGDYLSGSPLRLVPVPGCPPGSTVRGASLTAPSLLIIHRCAVRVKLVGEEGLEPSRVRF